MSGQGSFLSNLPQSIQQWSKMYNSHGMDDFDVILINGINAFVLAGKYNA
jgi:hypothetical protein